MDGNVASDLEAARPRSDRGIGKIAILAAKVAVTGLCFWYIARQIEMRQVAIAVAALDVRWATFAVLIATLQIPLVAMRWRAILDALGALDARMTLAAIMAISAIGSFFAQVLPNVASEGMRAWLLVRLGCDWRRAVTSVLIDRAVGVGLLIALGLGILLLPSGVIALGPYRQSVLLLYGAMLLAGLIGLWITPLIVPLLARWRYAGWIGTLAADAHRVLLGRKSPTILAIGCIVHALTILIVWSLARAQGLVLPLADAAVLFTVMIGVAIVPISISGWGLRELAVVSLLGNLGVAPETALLFSVCFGLTVALGSLPGALVWLLYSASPARSVAQGEGSSAG
jgi:glycosyltransferase 2 family protein